MLELEWHRTLIVLCIWSVMVNARLLLPIHPPIYLFVYLSIIYNVSALIYPINFSIQYLSIHSSIHCSYLLIYHLSYQFSIDHGVFTNDDRSQHCTLDPKSQLSCLFLHEFHASFHWRLLVLHRTVWKWHRNSYLPQKATTNCVTCNTWLGLFPCPTISYSSIWVYKNNGARRKVSKNETMGMPRSIYHMNNIR